MTRFNSALECAAAIKSRSISPVEVLDHYLAETDRLNPQLNAFALRDDDRARKDAIAAADIVANTPVEDLPPFIGVPIPIKDLNNVEGWLTTMGSSAVPDLPADEDDQPVARLRQAGFVLMGKTTTPEFGSISMTESQRFGATRNPWNPDYTPGGSSGGAGSAVAAGMAPIAHASDGGGSIRIPASCNGLVGLKASRNRITDRVARLAGATTSGVLSRTVADTAALLDVLSHIDHGAWNNPSAPPRPWSQEVGVAPGKLRIRVAQTNALGVPIDPACADAASETADLLADLGHEVSESDPIWPDAGQFLTAFLTVWSTITAGTDELNVDLLEPHNRASRAQAMATSSIEYAQAVIALQMASREVSSQFDRDFDVLVTPTMAVEPPAVGSIWIGAEDDPSMPMMNAAPMAAFTAMFNVTGQPAISLPLHTSESGLPIGVHFVGGPWQEETLIRLASQIESERPWADRWPTLAG
ncbi:MAG TPA: amidase [Microthrixaceae bacterium]|nr:amidase [Microthrixaceae bacterium]